MNLSMSRQDASGAHAQAKAESGVGDSPEFPRYMRISIIAIILSVTVFGRMGLNAGEYTVSFSLFIVYGLLFKAVLDSKVQIDPAGLLLFGFAAIVAAASFLSNNNMKPQSRVSFSSLMLLITLYLPFIFVLKPHMRSKENWLWVMRVLLNVSLFCALTGIAQFYLQFVVKQPWLFNVSPLLPTLLTDQGIYNSAIPVGSLFKSNGFFFREPSAFSYMMAFSIITELALFKRYKRVAVLGLGLMLSYSGTGILALAIGMMFPFGFKTAMRVGVILVAGMMIFLLFGDALNLTYTLGRVGEFSAERSSGYIRYVAPMRLINELVDSAPWTAFVGHGPGTIFRAERSYEFHDPTWAKLVYEYGVFGFTSFMLLITLSMSHSKAPIQIRAVMFSSWLVMGGHLLTPENVMMIYTLLAFWPRPVKSNSSKPFEELTTLPPEVLPFASTYSADYHP